MQRFIAARSRAGLVFAGIAFTLFASTSPVRASGPTSAYWITDGDASKVYKIVGGAVVQTIATPPQPDHEYPLAVTDNEVRTFAGITGYRGREYTPAGTPTGVTYTNTSSTFINNWDGTTDGVNYNYTFTQASHEVVRYDRNWANPVSLFTDATLGNGDNNWGGITYDLTDGSLWINRRSSSSANPSTTFRHYSTTGTLLGSFSLAVPGAWGLAYDRNTDTLWFTGYPSGGGTTIYNTSKTGTLLESDFIPGITNNPLGGEMSLPEPAMMTFLAAGSMLVIPRRRRRS